MDFACSGEFLAPNYAAMVVVSITAGHWRNYLFKFPKVEPPGIEGIPTLFEVAWAMGQWAEEVVQSALRADANRNSRVS